MIATLDERRQTPDVLLPLLEARCEWVISGIRCASQTGTYLCDRWLCSAHSEILIERRRQRMLSTS